MQLERSVDLDANAAAFIAKGMRAIAIADGHVHPRELALIEAFEADLPSLEVADNLKLPGEAAAVYVQSLVLVALADGVVSDDEREVIASLAKAQGYSKVMVDHEIVEAKRWFLSAFKGVRIFRDALLLIASDLGLSEEEVAKLTEDSAS